MNLIFLKNKLFFLFLLASFATVSLKAQVKFRVKSDSVFVDGGGNILFSVDNAGRIKIDSAGDGSSDAFLLTWDRMAKKIKKVSKSSLNPYTFSTGLTSSTGIITNNLSTGLAGGQSAVGGTAGGDSLRLSSTSNATKGKILLGNSAYDEANNRLGIGTNAPAYKLDVAGAARITDTLRLNTTPTGADSDSVLVINNGVVKKVLRTDGPMVLAKGNVSSVSTLDIDLSNWYTSYDIIQIYLISTRPATNSTMLWMRLSSDGTTYNSGASDYRWGYIYALDAASGNTGSATDSKIQLSGASGNATARSTSGIITLYNPGSSTFNPIISAQLTKTSDDGTITAISASGTRSNAQVTKAIRFLYSSGNISTATYKVVGIKN